MAAMRILKLSVNSQIKYKTTQKSFLKRNESINSVSVCTKEKVLDQHLIQGIETFMPNLVSTQYACL